MARRISSPELIGRQRELAELESHHSAARAGEPAVVLLGGEAGVGKTRLLEALLERSRAAGTRTLVGRSLDLGGGALPFAPVADALRQLVGDLERTEVARLLGPNRAELARIVPELGNRRVASAEGDRSEARMRLFVALHAALEALARERPLLLAFEDIHWADASTLDLIGFLTRHVRDEPVLLVATFRSDELHRRHPLPPVLAELGRLPATARIDLTPLADDDVARQVASILGQRPQPELVDELVRRTGGNAFFVEELLAARIDAGDRALSPLLRDVVGARLGQLPEATRQLLGVVAVAGPAAGHELLETVTGLRGQTLADVLRPAVEQHVLVADGQAHRFRHALVQEMVEDDLLPGERVSLHRTVAETLTDAGNLAASRRDHLDAELAHHWAAAQEHSRAFAASLRAAQQARDAAASTEAVRHYERALELWDGADRPADTPPRVEVLEATAQAAFDAGQIQRALGHLRTALQDPVVGDDPEREADLRRQLAQLLWSSGQADDAYTQTQTASELVQGREPSIAQVRVLTAYALMLLRHLDQDPSEAIPVARNAEAAARELADPLPRSIALRSLGMALAWTGDAAQLGEAIQYLREALQLARDTGSVHETRASYLVLFDAVFLHDQVTEAAALRDLAEEVLAWLDAGGDRVDQAYVYVNLGYAFLFSGEWERAADVLQRMARCHLEGFVLVGFHVVRGTFRWMRGHYEEAAADAARAREVGIPPRWYHDFFPFEAEVAAWRGQLEQTRAIAEEHLAVEAHPTEEVTKLGTVRPLVRAEVDAALTGGTARDGHVERAAVAVEQMREIVERYPPPSQSTFQLEHPYSYLALAEAEFSRATGPNPAAWRDVSERVYSPYWQTYVRWRLVEALLATDEREVAAAELLAARDQARRLGAAGLTKELEALARRARLSIPGIEGTAEPDDLGLTPREQEVLALLAEGYTNQEIAEELYIAKKTASVHVSNVLTKLEVDNRNKAASRARQLGLVDTR